MYHYSIMDPRAFIVYEACHGSLGNMLYDIYEEDRDDDINEDDKLYMIKYKPLYSELRKSPAFLKTMLYQIAQALDLLAQHKIVHSDIKTENILMNTHEDNPKYEFKLIDYGSSFVFENLKQYKLATPEYMCPELLNYILF
jgi:dual specificity tyrosine-phosphorylation-regulated kinase 2/3/4